MNLKTLILAPSLLINSAVFAQGSVLKSGTSATCIALGVAANDQIISYGGSFGFSINGTWDISAGFSKAYRSRSAYSGTAYGASTDYYFLKEDQGYPLSFSFGGSLVLADYSIGQSTIGAYSSVTYSFSGTVYHSFEITPKYCLQPWYELDWAQGRAHNARGNKSPIITATGHTIGLTVAIRTSVTQQTLITPAITFSAWIPEWEIEIAWVY